MLGPIRTRWHLWLGGKGERLAARHLRRSGLRVITTNYRAPSGEIDIIAREGDTLVFVEVKTRRRGEPAEAVHAEKQRKITRAALAFMKHHRLLERDVPCRFDVVAVVWPEPGTRSRPDIQHFRSAFDATGWNSMFT